MEQNSCNVCLNNMNMVSQWLSLMPCLFHFVLRFLKSVSHFPPYSGKFVVDLKIIFCWLVFSACTNHQKKWRKRFTLKRTKPYRHNMHMFYLITINPIHWMHRYAILCISIMKDLKCILDLNMHQKKYKNKTLQLSSPY